MNSITDILNSFRKVKSNLFVQPGDYEQDSTVQNTLDRFYLKWIEYSHNLEVGDIIDQIKQRFLRLYGFRDENDFASFLSDKNLIFDAECGLGFKTIWVAQLKTNCIVLGMDISDYVFTASEKYKNIDNLFFIKGDISETMFPKDYFDFVICDEVLRYPIDPPKTLKELSRVTKSNGYIFTYVYCIKSIPRELLDEYFNKKTLIYLTKKLWCFMNS
ncbi:MAG: class I SAM-dependent methyltransferase [bacterium]|nr:class I SAM-dependent methyltransferase [bacterium]